MSKINTDDHPLYMGKVIAASDVISVDDKSYINAIRKRNDYVLQCSKFRFY